MEKLRNLLGGRLERLVRKESIWIFWFLPANLAWPPVKIQNVPVYFPDPSKLARYLFRDGG
jgi:hypothetical protein